MGRPRKKLSPDQTEVRVSLVAPRELVEEIDSRVDKMNREPDLAVATQALTGVRRASRQTVLVEVAQQGLRAAAKEAALSRREDELSRKEAQLDVEARRAADSGMPSLSASEVAEVTKFRRQRELFDAGIEAFRERGLGSLRVMRASYIVFAALLWSGGRSTAAGLEPMTHYGRVSVNEALRELVGAELVARRRRRTESPIGSLVYRVLPWDADERVEESVQ